MITIPPARTPPSGTHGSSNSCSDCHTGAWSSAGPWPRSQAVSVFSKACHQTPFNSLVSSHDQITATGGTCVHAGSGCNALQRLDDATWPIYHSVDIPGPIYHSGFFNYSILGCWDPWLSLPMLFLLCFASCTYRSLGENS